ncbi:cyclic lactone autoinducer peptide [Enterococcus sp. ZJ1668]|nr:cyclic lactone autoinducer peptide [Enterococcus sp. ZJ1668]
MGNKSSKISTIIANAAIGVADHALTVVQGSCHFATYEPKIPEALKKAQMKSCTV